MWEYIEWILGEKKSRKTASSWMIFAYCVDKSEKIT